jgi:methylthioribose-1-phosphate isomerase
MHVDGKNYRTIWMENNAVYMIDQNQLPCNFEVICCTTWQHVAEAISIMTIRGAPAIGAAGAYGLALAAANASDDNFPATVAEAKNALENTRPTARDLFFALEKVYAAITAQKTADDARMAAYNAAVELADANADACHTIGMYGDSLLEDGMTLLTHCNAGWLATVDWGTALSPVYVAKRNGKNIRVLADETRPRCQGARLTAWELLHENINVSLIADNAAGYFMRAREIDICITGTDRVAANGDVANKIGTYEKAVVAYENNIPFYIAAPFSTFDTSCSEGDEIPIEERSENELLYCEGFTTQGERLQLRSAPHGVSALNPAFDITPAKYITGIITEKGIISADANSIRHFIKTYDE